MTNRANQLKKVRETFFLGQSVSESEEISNTEKSATRRGIANLTKDDNFRLSLAEKGPTTDNQLGNGPILDRLRLAASGYCLIKGNFVRKFS